MPNYDEFELEYNFDERSTRKAYAFGYRLGSGKPLPQGDKNWKPSDTLRDKCEYVYFGSFPQSIKSRKVSIGAQIGDCLFRGSDGGVYCEKTYLRNGGGVHAGRFSYAGSSHSINATISRYSDGQKEGTYFKIEPIKWRVIKRENGVLTLMSEYILFHYYFNKCGSSIFALVNTGGTWKSSAVRRVLNDNFYRTAFSAEEQSKIVQTTVKTESDKLSFAEKLSDTDCVDKVFILSKAECESYGLTKRDLKRHQTDFNGHFIDCVEETPYVTYTPWMTRTSCGLSSVNDYVYPYMVTGGGTVTDSKSEFIGIAPVICVREKDVTVSSDGSPQTATESPAAPADNYPQKENANPSSQPQQPKQELTLKNRILYTVLAPVCWLAGLLLGSIVTGGGSTGNLGGFATLAYLVFSEVMVWKLNSKQKILLAVVGNAVVSFLCWLLLGIYG